jgi:hypothetical protein
VAVTYRQQTTYGHVLGGGGTQNAEKGYAECRKRVRRMPKKGTQNAVENFPNPQAFAQLTVAMARILAV